MVPALRNTNSLAPRKEGLKKLTYNALTPRKDGTYSLNHKALPGRRQEQVNRIDRMKAMTDLFVVWGGYFCIFLMISF